MVNQIAVMLENALAHEQVERLSITDGLTGIYNRRYMNERLEEEFAKVQRYEAEMSVLLLDLDHFKQINDNFGHQVGDRTLVSVAECLNTMLRESDMLGRYGGEEFLVMLPHTNLTDATHTADKLRKAIGELQISGMGEKRVTVSIGVATFPNTGIDSLDALVRHADEALYKAKESGRNRVVTAA
jgi:diguanylate cyclase (GGDEF)-like protein